MRWRVTMQNGLLTVSWNIHFLLCYQTCASNEINSVGDVRLSRGFLLPFARRCIVMLASWRVKGTNKSLLLFLSVLGISTSELDFWCSSGAFFVGDSLGPENMPRSQLSNWLERKKVFVTFVVWAFVDVEEDSLLVRTIPSSKHTQK